MPMTGAARLAGIMGWPVAHSRSPALHGFWLAEHGIDGAYVPLAVEPDRLAQALRALPALGFRGCNLTIPHKEAAFAVMDRVDPFARRIGAMNTVVVAEDGRLEGSNTDVFGFRENLREQAPDWNPAAGPAAVLGGGGSARAVVAALNAARVAEVRLVNRTAARAETLERDLAQPGTADRDLSVGQTAASAERRRHPRQHDKPWDGQGATAGHRPGGAAVIGCGRRHGLGAARIRAARRGAASRAPCRRRARHAVASGPHRFRGLVRGRAGKSRPALRAAMLATFPAR